VAVAYIALGGNLGDRAGYLRSAVAQLESTPELQLQARSPLYDTEPAGGEPQPRYLNAVVRIETALPPRALLDRCLAVERALGRDRPAGAVNAPRNIDLDLLLVGDLIVEEPGLQLPHPRLLQRPFVRVPLAAVAEPGLLHPITGDRLDRAAPDPDVREAGGL
jgi:2-amino-4-hydroxy-6-hydroxymethyldihydropteridine diphosphokinase